MEEVNYAEVVGESKESCRITVPPPLPSALQQHRLRLKLAKTSFDDIQDLQLAAELGRALLERNEELETELKQQQIIMDDQGQEIEFLTKQLNSMKEESASRAKIYEQLESSICELERTNSQLSRKHDVDKKRIQSLCENIEYLERKCEELNVTLQSMKSEHGKNASGHGKVNRNAYSSGFGSDSSEEEMSSSFGLSAGAIGGYRRRSHSLQDLRDYTPSPDEFDSGNSNSPDLKTSESEFIDSLESRIEELQSLKKKETDKVRQLETQIKLLIQENANLQQQIVQICDDKDEEISELRKHLQDSSNYNSQLNASFVPVLSSTRRSSETNSSASNAGGTSSASSSFHISANSSPSSLPFSSTSIGLGSSIISSSAIHNNSRLVPQHPVCKRCSAEMSILNLVNSIEHDNINDDMNCYEWEFGNPEDDNMEFSSLEHELARATGTPYRSRDNRLASTHHGSVLETCNFHSSSSSVTTPTTLSGRSSRRSSLNNNNNNLSASSNLPFSPKKLARNRKLKEYLRTNPSQIDIEEMDYENLEIFDIFFSHDDKDETGEDVLGEHSPSKVRFNKDNRGDGESSSSSTDEENTSDSRLDEDPCLIKDRKPEFSKGKGGKSKGKKSKGAATIVIHTSSSSCEDHVHKNKNSNAGSCDSSDVVEDSSICGSSGEEGPQSVMSIYLQSSTSASHSRFLELPARIPSDDDDEISESSGVSSAVGDEVVVSQQLQVEVNHEKSGGNLGGEIVKPSKGSSLLYQKQESSSSSGYESEYSSTSTCKRDHRNSSSDCSNSDSELSTVPGTLESSTLTEDGLYVTRTTCTDEDTTVSISITASSAWASSTRQPEYKQILHNLFNIFNNSKRKYPIPMYPFIQEARRQSSGLTFTSTNSNSNNTAN